MVVLNILKLDFMTVAVGGIFAVREHEVEDADRVDILQMIVPRSLGRLLADGRGGVIDAAVLEEGLFRLLHLHDEAASVPGCAIDIEDGAAVATAVAEVFAVEVLDVLNLLLTVVEQGVEETDEQVLVHLRAEKFLEAEVSVGVNVLFFRHIYHDFFVICWYNAAFPFLLCHCIIMNEITNNNPIANITNP